MGTILFGLGQSPWTERARWALEHHGIVYEYREHTPMLGELSLRRKARAKKASVPLLVDGEVVVMGSTAIAKHVEQGGRGTPLFPREHEAEVSRWVEVAERMSELGRAWLMRRLLESRRAQSEALPSFVPGALRGALAPTAGLAVRFLVSKYAVPVGAAVEEAMRPLLLDVRAVLEGRDYVLGASGFSFADLALAATMEALRPHADSKLGPATRDARTNEALAREFADLIEWRDAIFAKHR
ncbi:MAG TPA: glutathione S-transferase [Labilithrix sp.]|jgi:glutathione S-transferase|nr:glutathione S-transferase [Labilithrix sp.]